MASATAIPETGLGEADPEQVAGRYDVLDLLGRGGMAAAYRVRDRETGDLIALKRLMLRREAPGTDSAQDAERDARVIELFEREYHTLKQLAHPRVVAAFDYGVDEGCPYYTMELLDGGDVRELSPIPHQRACMLGYEICSALSLLHSRGLVHRDLTPRNVRLTGDGKAKLIDFGLLAHMGPTTIVAGTPPYVAPELVQTMTLDGRSDLFSLGATLYHALTGRTAFPARRFDELVDVWRAAPVPPSRIVPGIPAAVDEIVLSLLRVDVGSRPKSAAEVMERLEPLLDEPPSEALSVAGAYLTAPRLVGRDGEIVRLRKRTLRAVRRRGGGFLVMSGEGCGRSRLIDAFVLESKLIGACTLRAGADQASSRPFGVARALAEQLRRAAPETTRAFADAQPQQAGLLLDLANASAEATVTLRPWTDGEASHAGQQTDLQQALLAWFMYVARSRPMGVAVDDFDRVDSPSAAFIASLALSARGTRLAYAAAIRDVDPGTGSDAIEILREHSEVMPLSPLDAAQTTELLLSVFGDVPHLQLLSARLHTLSAGRPRACMQLAQHLVDQGIIKYRGGAWRLPEAIAPDVLPDELARTVEQQIERLGDNAFRIGLMLALSCLPRMSRSEMLHALQVAPHAVDAALEELRAAQLITGGEDGYALRDAGLSELLAGRAEAGARRRCHDTLAALHADSGRSESAICFHMLQGETPASGFSRLVGRLVDGDERLAFIEEAVADTSDSGTARVLSLALAHAAEHGCHRRDLQSLWVMSIGMAARGQDASLFYDVPGDFVARLKRDSGFDDYHALDADKDEATRAIEAFGLAQARFDNTPEDERVQAPFDTIKQLIFYVLAAIAVGVRTYDLELLTGLPRLLAPFAPLSPVARAMLTNAEATVANNLGKREVGRTRFAQTLHTIDELPEESAGYMSKVVSALRETLLELDAMLGVATDRKESDLQHFDASNTVGVAYLRKVIALHRGDWDAAEECRRRAELLALQSRSGRMFSTLGPELEVHALARDLTGLRSVREAIARMAQRYPGWRPLQDVADAHYQRLCGQRDSALQILARFREAQAAARQPSPWRINAAALETELLVEAGDLATALARGREALADCERDEMHHLGRLVGCALSLAESASGEYAEASARLDAIQASLLELGASGLLLGYAYECSARVAIDASDAAAFDRYAELAGQQYRVGRSDVLGALHARLMEAAARAGIDSDSIHPGNTLPVSSEMSTCWSHVSSIMSQCKDRHERAQRALGLLCDDERPRDGHLFLVLDGDLQLCASNVDCANRQAMYAYARGILDAELDDDMHTMTSVGGDESALDSLSVEPFRGGSDGEGGAPYRPLVLRGRGEGQTGVVGIALLTGAPPDGRSSLLDVASAVANNLVQSGDYQLLADA